MKAYKTPDLQVIEIDLCESIMTVSNNGVNDNAEFGMDDVLGGGEG